MVDEGRHRWLRLHQQQHQCARTTTAVAKASLLRTRAAFCMQRRPRRRLHAVDLAAEGPQPSLPGPDARSLALCVALLSACLPASRAPSLPLCVPGRLRRALSCSLAAHARTSLRLAVLLGTPLLAAEAHTSATTADLSTPPPHPSPSLCSRQESSRHMGPASVARACPAARAASLSHRRKGSLVALRSARMTSRACAAGGISRLEISSVQGGRAGNGCFVLLAHRLISNQGFWRASALRYQLAVSHRACIIVAYTWTVCSRWIDGP